MPRRKERKLGDWRDEARCVSVQQDGVELAKPQRVNLFYPERSHAEAAKAKAVCRLCPVRSECLTESIANNEKFGIWGGMDTLERSKEAKRRKNGKDD